MAKHTKKYLAAVHQLDEIGQGRALILRGADGDKLYAVLQQVGYSWDHKQGKWHKWETPKGGLKTGVVKIRVRASLGDIERATKLVGEALEKAGFKVIELTPPDPDDRHGPAVTARVYMEWMLPDSPHP